MPAASKIASPGARDRGRRRHGRARHERRAAPALPGRGESARPGAVVSLHVGFINAGADLIEANSFGANRRKLAQHFLEDDLEAINSTAVKLARQARETVGRDVFIAGSIGPLGEPASARVRHELFAEQAAILEGRGADLLMVETFYDLEELVDAIEGIREVSALPIVALLTFDEGAVTLAGVTAAGSRAAPRRRWTSPRSERTTAPASSLR